MEMKPQQQTTDSNLYLRAPMNVFLFFRSFEAATIQHTHNIMHEKWRRNELSSSLILALKSFIYSTDCKVLIEIVLLITEINPIQLTFRIVNAD